MSVIPMIIISLIVVPCLLGLAVLALELVQGEIPMVESERNRILSKIPRQRRHSD